MNSELSKPVIVLTGGGSGGHITPLVAVAERLNQLEPDLKIAYIGQKGDKFGGITTKQFDFDQIFRVRAGKFRRYHGEGLKQFLDIGVTLRNIRDFFYVIYGFVQALIILRRLRPNLIFIKGGYIGVPVGLAAAMLGIPYITHDSDALPGLANRIIARWAVIHAVALPKEVYNYPEDKTITTGIPVKSDFKLVTEKAKDAYRKEISVPEKSKLLFVIGGGIGALRVNQAVAETLPHLLSDINDLYVVQSAGEGNQAAINDLYNERLNAEEQGRIKVFGFIDDVYKYSGAADLIVTRAGATNLAEFAIQGKACIVIPNPSLAGGHQIKNTAVLKETSAIAVLEEPGLLADPNRLSKLVTGLIQDKEKLSLLGQRLRDLAVPDATDNIAKLIIDNLGKT